MADATTALTLQPGNGCWTGRGLVFQLEPPRPISLARYAEQWLSLSSARRVRTIDGYRYRLEQHVLPKLGKRPIAEIEPEEILDLLRDLRLRGYSAWTCHSVVSVLKALFSHAVRRGVIFTSPFSRIEPSECARPPAAARRILNGSEISALLAATAVQHRALLSTAIFTGLRQSELFALKWENVDFDRGVVRVETALDRQQRHVPVKTAAARREVVIPTRLLAVLENEKRHSPYSCGGDYVFASRVGTPLHWRNSSRRIFKPALKRAQLPGRVRWHDLRHTYASMLIAGGANILFVSRQLGHAHPQITLHLYGDLFGIQEQGDRARNALERFMPYTETGS